MKFDDIDIGIIHFLHDNPSQTTTDIAKKIFGTKEQRDVQKNDALVRLRVSKLVEKKILLCSPTTPKTYSSNPEFVCCGYGVLNININGGKKMDINFGDFLVITDSSDFIYLRRISKNGNGNMPKVIA
jgi:hypothetical protein